MSFKLPQNVMAGARPVLLAAALALPAAAIAPSAFAQPAATSPLAPKTVKHSAAADGNAAERVEARITQLHSELHITPQLEPQWKQFADTMRANAQGMDTNVRARQAALPTMSALDDMQSYSKLADQHAQDVQKLVGAFQTLYDAMSDDQKKVADAVFRSDSTSSAKRKG
jgi:hypothetical protein